MCFLIGFIGMFLAFQVSKVSIFWALVIACVTGGLMSPHIGEEETKDN